MAVSPIAKASLDPVVAGTPVQMPLDCIPNLGRPRSPIAPSQCVEAVEMLFGQIYKDTHVILIS